MEHRVYEEREITHERAIKSTAEINNIDNSNNKNQ